MVEQTTFLIEVEYDGTQYCGWQVQPNGVTVQQRLEEALAHLTGEPLRVRGASRTDSGVHARGQVASFRSTTTIPPRKMCRALSSRLPKDIVVRRSCRAPEGFDPRHGAVRKLYRYTLATGALRPALGRMYAWHVPFSLQVESMQAAAHRLIGTHDYTSFSNMDRLGEENVRTVDRIDLIETQDRLVIEVEGRSFLYNMVRNLAGTLVDVGTGRFHPDEMEAIFQAHNRKAAGQGAPACGLCLEWIRYDPSPWPGSPSA